MSRVIKFSRIIGEYHVRDIEVIPQQVNDEVCCDKVCSENNKKTDEEHHENYQLEEQMKQTAAAVETEEEPETVKAVEEINKRIIDKELDRARRKSEEIVQQAEEEAAKIITAAREKADEELEKAEEEGFEKGKKEGYEAGYEEGHEEGRKAGYEDLIDTYETLVEAVKESREKMDAELKRISDEVVKLAVKIASRIVNVELETNPACINDIIQDVLNDISSNYEELVIKVNPELIEYIDKAQVESTLPRKSIEFIPDDSLVKGDCIIETDFGGKDATLVNKLDMIENELYKGVDSDGQA